MENELLEAIKELLTCIPHHDIRGMSPDYSDALKRVKEAVKAEEKKA